jgi:hypothetical protein
MDLNSQWENYANFGVFDVDHEEETNNSKTPKCSDIYISTKTKIAYLNTSIDLFDIFWRLPIIKYEIPKEGILKKQIKINSLTQEDANELERKLEEEKKINTVNYEIIQQINNPNARKNKFKDIRKINIGINTKDLISYRKKKKGAFYNCFAIILRILYNNKFKEIHIKVFNTGKLEIPGIQNDTMLNISLKNLLQILQPFVPKKLDYNKNNIQTVLINSNFSCNYIINRNKLFDILKYNYNITALYDPCSYPGIQCKYYYNENNTKNDGICHCSKKCSSKNKTCTIVSFMIFRTGSILIVGQCNEEILNIIYKFVCKLLIKEYDNIKINSILDENKTEKKTVKKKRKKKIIVYLPKN